MPLGLALALLVTVKIDVTVPRHFRETPRIFLGGSHEALGKWKADAVTLHRKGEKYVAEVRLPADTPVEMKLSLGDWGHAETTVTGGERPNRRLRCGGDCSVSVDVDNFRLAAFHAVPSTASWSVTYHHEFYAPAFDNWRNLAVYLPPQYLREPGRKFPVLYALDGNNLFDVATMRMGKTEWSLDETLDRVFAEGKLEPFIVVGVYNTRRRADEYLPCRDKDAGGMAEDYGKFLISTVKPFIDERYRTLPDRKNTALMGSSFGGTFTLYAARRFGTVFSRFVAMSPAVWWKDYCLLDELAETYEHKPDRVWLDMGDDEGKDLKTFENGVEDIRLAEAALLKHSGLSPENIRRVVDPGAGHNEVFWGRRAEAALRFVWFKR